MKQKKEQNGLIFKSYFHAPNEGEVYKSAMNKLSDKTLNNFTPISMATTAKEEFKNKLAIEEWVNSYVGAAKQLAQLNQNRCNGGKTGYALYKYNYTLPTVFLIRHAAELAIKEAIDKSGKVPNSSTHDLDKLWNSISSQLPESKTPALTWIADRDALESGQMYMAIHQHDEDANNLWLYFQSVINWAKMLFPTKRKGITNAQAWGLLYNKYHSRQYNSNALEADIKQLVMDDDVTKKAGIVPYILSDRTWRDEKHLSLRAFTESQKLRAYERQGHKCPLCVANGINTEYAYEDMEGDHIIPWSKGGHTTDDNLQMLCKKCNSAKSDN